MYSNTWSIHDYHCSYESEWFLVNSVKHIAEKKTVKKVLLLLLSWVCCCSCCCCCYYCQEDERLNQFVRSRKDAKLYGHFVVATGCSFIEYRVFLLFPNSVRPASDWSVMPSDGPWAKSGVHTPATPRKMPRKAASTYTDGPRVLSLF